MRTASLFRPAILAGLLAVISLPAQEPAVRPLWKKAAPETVAAARSAVAKPDRARRLRPVAGETVALDHAELGRRLAAVLPEGLGTMAETGTEIELPLPDGTTGRFLLVESPILAPALAAKYPQLRTFSLQGIDDPAATGRADLTPAGFRAFVLSPRGQFFVDPCWRDDAETHMSYYRRDYFDAEKSQFGCTVEQALRTAQEENLAALPADLAERPTGAQLRTYRLAVGATAEYAAAVSGTSPGTVQQTLAAIITTVNRVSAVYEREFAVRLQLIANEDAIIFTDSATDGYTDNNPSSLLTENQTKLDAVILPANYDIGHVFSTGGGGIAGLGVVCWPGLKGHGVTGSPNPVGDPYDIDYVAHEMGHQFGGNHTFDGTTGSCTGSNRNASTAYEPGSGTTIMAYAGICSPQDLAPNSDDYFHSVSYDEIVAYTNSGLGSTCAVLSATGNTVPVISALASYSIPANTPFALTASASDADGDTLTYCWEEFDKSDSATGKNPTAAPRDNGVSPIFRSYAPTLSPTRVFPSPEYILANANVPPATIGSFVSGEVLPDTNRTMTFRVTVRDNRAGGGATEYAATTVTSVKTSGVTFGPFRISSHNAAASIAAGAAFNVTWDVANSNLAPVSCANVKISLSTDGGRTFPLVLLASTPNTGTASVTIPNLGQYATAQARLKVESVGNIFFDINDADLTVTTAHPAPTFTVTGSVTARRGTPTPTVAVVGTAASSSGSTPFTATVLGAPFGATVVASIDGLNQVSLSATLACAVTTTNTTRTYPLTVIVADSLGSTVAKTVNLVVQPNLAPTAATYPAATIALGRTATFAPATLASDGNGNLKVAPYSISPASLPGGGTAAVDAATGVVSVTTTGTTTVGTVKLFVAATDACGAAGVREIGLAVTNTGPAFVAGALAAPTAESALPGNGVVDPGETVTLLLPVKNVGSVSTTSLVGTLQAGGGVLLPAGAGAYGTVAPGATAAVPFTFQAAGACGGTVLAKLALQDGATSYTPITFSIRLGVLTPGTVLLTQNFDSVAPPALPAGWTSSILQGSAPGWTTSTTSPQTSPNSISVTPTTTVSDKALVAPAFAVPANATALRLTFQHRWRTESGYDGGVLEISVDGGAYQDVTAAGGVFSAGGYNDASIDGPLSGRLVWGGLFNTSYTLTALDLPDALAGHTVGFRWRLGCDSGTVPSSAIWRIDSISCTATTAVCATAPAITSALPAGPLIVGSPYTHTFTATGAPAPTIAKTAGSWPAGLSLTSGGTLSGTPTAAGTGTFAGIVVTASNGIAPAATQGFGLSVVTRLANYMAGYGVVGANALPLADPDGDGLNNALEYALAQNPTVANASPVLVEPRNYAGTDYLALVHTRSSVATDVTYVVEGLSDLDAGGWTTLSSSVAGAASSGAGLVGETGSAPNYVVETRDTVPLATAVPPRRFLRLRVVIAP